VPATEPPAIAVSATVEPPLPASAGTKHAAWILGSRFSLAALANDRGIVPEDVPKWFEEARSKAELLNIPLAALPARPATPQPAGPPSREVLDYIVNQEKSIAEQLATDRGDQHAALLRMAVRSNLLLVLNTPGTKAVETLTKSLTDLGPQTGLPPELWQPLLDLLAQNATPAAVRKAVPQMHADVEQHLAAEQ
jgi:hypothetical protein